MLAAYGWCRALLRRTDAVALGCVLLFSLLTRLLWLEELPTNVTADEADTLRDVYRIASGTGPGFFGLDWTPLPAFGAYVQTLAMSVFGFSVDSLRLPSVLLSTLALVPFYVLAQRIAGWRAALLATLLLSVDPWYLNFSRSGWTNVWIALFLLSAMLCLERGLTTGRMRWFAGAGVFCALGLYGYYAGRMVLPVLLAYLPFALWQHRARARTVLVGYAVLTTVALMLFAPQAVTLAQDWELTNRRVSAVSIFAEVRSLEQGASILFDQVVRVSRAFLLVEPGLFTNGRYTPIGAPLFDPLVRIAYWVGFVVCLWRWRQTALWWTALFIGLFPVQVLTRDVPDGARAVGFAPVLYLFVAAGVGAILHARLPFRKLQGPSVKAWARAGVAVATVASVGLSLEAYVAWMRSPASAQARQPAVEMAEFTTWQSLQLVEARAGRHGFNVNEWHQRRGTVAASVEAQTLSAPVQPSGGSPPLVARDDASAAPLKGALLPTPLADLPLQDPRGVAAGPDGQVYIVETAAARVTAFTQAGERVRTLSFEEGGQSGFQEPFDVALDRAGRVYVVDSLCGCVQRFDADGRHEATLLASAGLYRPRGLFLSRDDRLYVADTGRSRIVQATLDGEVTKTWSAESGSDLQEPTDVAVDANGNLYAVLPTVQSLVKLAPDGRVLVRRPIAPSNSRESPHLAWTGGEQLALTETGASRVGLLDADLRWVATVQPEQVMLQQPIGIAAGAGGEVWVTDAQRGTVYGVTITP